MKLVRRLVKALCEYLDYSKHTSGPLFQIIDKVPISYAKVSSHSKTADSAIHWSESQKGHSFRIDAATYAASLGYSENLIQKLGRWNSDAFVAIYVYSLLSFECYTFAYRSASAWLLYIHMFSDVPICKEILLIT